MNKILEYTYDKVVNKKSYSAIRWSELFICIVGFMIGRINILDGINPLCIAYIGATYQTANLKRWNVIFTLLGVLSISKSLRFSIKYIAIILLISLVRWYISVMRHNFNLLAEALLASISTFAIGIVIIAVRGFTIYDFMHMFLETVFIFALVFIYQKGIEVMIESRKTPLTNQQVIGVTVLLVSILGGMIELYIEFSRGNRIYVRDIICFFLILAISYLGGTTLGASMGTVIGTLLVMIGYIPPHLISMYALSGLCGGLLQSIGKIGVAIGVLAGHIIGLYFINEGIIDNSLVGAYILGVILFFICPNNFFGFAYWFGDKEKEYEQEVHMNRIRQMTTIKLESFAGAFKKLATTFSNISTKKTVLTQKDISRLLEDVADRVCSQCGLVEYCWNKDFYNTYQAACGILSTLENKNHITSFDVPKVFQDKCMHVEHFVQSLNQAFELYKQNLMWHNRMVESRELISEQLEAVASIIKRLSNELDEEVVFKRDMEKQVKEEIGAKGIKIKDVIIILNSDKKYEVTIIASYYSGIKEYQDIIIDIVSKVIGRVFKSEYYHTLSNQGEITIKLTEQHTYGVVAGVASRAKEDGVSGDHHSAMEISEGQYLLALSDGMGSGISAHNESVATIELLEEFIKSGFDKDTAIRIINSVLILKSSEESFSTMDMAIVDMYSGITEFIKIGAATTFIKKKDYVEVIGSSSLPVGILNKVDIETYKKQLRDGDMIIMVTDGILDVEKNKFNQERTFINLIQEIDSNNPQHVADCLLEKARNLICDVESDDMTVIVARIWEKA